MVLRRHGHTVHLAPDGQAAVRMRQTQPFDLILMDLQMPHMDGMEAARAIRAWEADTGTAAIPHHRPVCQRAGARPHRL